MCSTCIGSAPTTKSRKSSMQAMVAPALPSSVPSPHPTRPWLVSSLQKTYGRSEVGVSETPNTFMPVTFRPDCSGSKPASVAAAWPRPNCCGAKPQPQSMVSALRRPALCKRQAGGAQAEKRSTPHGISPRLIHSPECRDPDRSEASGNRRAASPVRRTRSRRAFRDPPDRPAAAHAE